MACTKDEKDETLLFEAGFESLRYIYRFGQRPPAHKTTQSCTITSSKTNSTNTPQVKAPYTTSSFTSALHDTENGASITTARSASPLSEPPKSRLSTARDFVYQGPEPKSVLEFVNSATNSLVEILSMYKDFISDEKKQSILATITKEIGGESSQLTGLTTV